MGTGPLETAVALMTSGLDHLQLAIEHVYLCRDVKDMGVRLMVASDLGGQTPIVCAASQLDGPVVGG